MSSLLDDMTDAVVELTAIDSTLDKLADLIDRMIAEDPDFTELWKGLIPPTVNTISYDNERNVEVLLQTVSDEDLVSLLEDTLNGLGEDDCIRFVFLPGSWGARR